MKSVKPGRGPSMMGGIASLFSALFGVVWTYIAMQGGAGPFALFGIVFIGMALAQAWYNFHNASQKDRFSSFDIVDSREEPDPLDPRVYPDRKNPFPIRIAPFIATALTVVLNFSRTTGFALYAAKNYTDYFNSFRFRRCSAMTASHRIGRILRKYRLEHDLSEEAISDLCEISTRHYRDLRKTAVPIPSWIPLNASSMPLI